MMGRHAATRSTRTKAVMVLVLSLALVSSPALADGDNGGFAVWNDPAIAGLFPKPGRNWQADDPDIQRLKSLMSDLETAAHAFGGPPPRVRLKATQHYTSRERRIAVSIDTEAIEMAAVIDAVQSAYRDNSPMRAELAEAGTMSITHQGVPGIAASEGTQAARAFKLGRVGVLAMECDYADCGTDLDAMLDRMDFDAIGAFAGFDHRE